MPCEILQGARHTLRGEEFSVSFLFFTVVTLEIFFDPGYSGMVIVIIEGFAP